MDIPGSQIWAAEGHQIAPQHSALSAAVSISTMGCVCVSLTVMGSCVLSSLRLALSPSAAAAAASNKSSLCLSHPFSERMSHALSTFHAPRHSLVTMSLEALTSLYSLYTPTSTKCEQLRPFFEVTHLQSRVGDFAPQCVHFSGLLCLFLLACVSYCQPFHSANSP